MPARRILITGVANFWGIGLARALLADPEVEQVVGIDTRIPPADLAAQISLVQSVIAGRLVVFGEPLPDGALAVTARLAAFCLVVAAAFLTPAPRPAER